MSTKVIDISNPEYTEKFIAIRDKHGEFQNLKHYLEKIQFWNDNNLTEHGFYYLCYELINTPKDKNPKIFSLQPQTPDETRLLNEALFKFHFESGYNDRIDEINKIIEISPLPINYIEECIKDIEDRYSIEVLPEVNVFNADYYGYTAAKQGRMETFYDFDIHTVIDIVRMFATGAIDAHIQGYLIGKLTDTERKNKEQKDTPEVATPIKDITPLKDLMNTNNENDFIKVINSIYDLVKHNVEDRRADKMKVRYTTHLLIKNGWLIDSNSNKQKYFTAILEYFGYKPNKGDFQVFNFPDVNDFTTPDNNRKYNSIYSIVTENKDKRHK
jgi:hypothetical protein